MKEQKKQWQKPHEEIKPKKKSKRPRRQAIKDDLKRWDTVDWEKYSDE